jgi:hypothetical protein
VDEERNGSRYWWISSELKKKKSNIMKRKIRIKGYGGKRNDVKKY